MNVRPFRDNDSDEVLAIAAELPQWFTERGLQQLSVDLRFQRGLVTQDGFLTWYVAEGVAHIGWMGVRPASHRKGIGRALVEALVAELTAGPVREVHVDTLGPGIDYKPYAKTRAFYEGVGFVQHALIQQDDPEWPERLVLKRVIPREPSV